MESKSIQYFGIVIIALLAAIGLSSFFNNGKLSTALDHLKEAKVSIESLKSEITSSQDSLSKLIERIDVQEQLIAVLDNQVRINYDQFKARLDQPTFDARMRALDELQHKVDSIEIERARILNILNSGK